MAGEGAFDLTRKYVRELRRLPNGLVEFEFAIGDPELAVELVMPEAAFAEFCRTNEAQTLPPRVSGPGTEQATDAAEDFRWTLQDATRQRFRNPH